MTRHFLMPSFSVPEQIQATEGGEQIQATEGREQLQLQATEGGETALASNSNFSATEGGEQIQATEGGEQIQATEGGETAFASNSIFSATVRWFAIDVHFSSTDRSLFSVESAYRYCCQQVVQGQTSSDTSERQLPEAEIMRCNACWQELEGRAVSTACGHLFCTEDASKILNNDAVCPICDQVLSKSLIKPVDINPNDEWANMAMVGVTPQTLMKSAYRSVMFFIGQKELQMQFKMNRMAAQCRQKCEALQEKCEAMQEKFTEKLEQVHTAYQKMAMKCQMMGQENARLSKENQELKENLAEKSRQKRKLDEMYDNLKSEYESVKRSAIRPASRSNFYSSTEPDFFADTNNMNNMIGSGDPIREDWSISRPQTPGPREDIWTAPARQSSPNNSGQFSFPGGSAMKRSTIPMDSNNRSRLGGDSAFGGGAPSNSSMSLRNLILSPIKRPQLTRNRNQL